MLMLREQEDMVMCGLTGVLLVTEQKQTGWHGKQLHKRGTEKWAECCVYEQRQTNFSFYYSQILLQIIEHNQPLEICYFTGQFPSFI